MDTSTLVRFAERPWAQGRLAVRENVTGCGRLFAQAGAVTQMAGYNSTFEALVAGCRPILIPRTHPRREQLIRAKRLAELGLVDVLYKHSDPADLVALLGQPSRLSAGALERAGIWCDGARRAASVLVELADRRTMGSRTCRGTPL